MLLKKEVVTSCAVSVFLGIDISKEYFDVVVVTESRREAHSRFSNGPKGFTAFGKWIKEQAKGLQISVTYACMEATGAHWKRLAKWLHEKGTVTFVVNPARIKGYFKSEQKRSKTDKVDAGVIARFCRAQFSELRSWVPPRAEVSKLQAIFRTRFSLVDMRTMLKNQLKSGALLPEMKQQMRQHLKYYDDQIKNLERQMRELIAGDEQFRKMARSGNSLGKGVGLITIVALIAECQEFSGFESRKQVAAFAGLDVSEYTSGSSVRGKPRISKQGNPRLRRILYLAANQASKRNPALKPLYDRLVQKGLARKAAVIACARKMLELLFVLMKNGREFDLNHFQSNIAA